MDELPYFKEELTSLLLSLSPCKQTQWNNRAEPSLENEEENKKHRCWFVSLFPSEGFAFDNSIVYRRVMDENITK